MFGDNQFTIPVQAEEITMAVHRKLHAFPVPFSNSQRVGLDTNMAAMEMNLSLILEDDRGTFESTGRPLQNILSFASYPTDKVVHHFEPSDLRFTSFGNYAAGATSISITIPRSNVFQAMVDASAATAIFDNFGQVGTKAVSESMKVNTVGSVYKFDLTLTGGGLTRELKTGDLVVVKSSPFASKAVYVPVASATNDTGHVIKLIMDGSTTSNRAGGSGTASVRSGHNLIENGDVIIDVPVGGIDTNPDNGNPAKTIALVVKDALELTTNITNLSEGVDTVGGKRVTDVADVTVSQYNDAVLLVTQKFTNQRAGFGYNVVGRYDTLTDTITTMANKKTQGNLMSAGDKAQTLMGLFANASNSDDLLRGIQIPYDSLIQSNAVTPEVRNFFTTYGRKVKASQKTSEANILPSSQPMLSPSATSRSGQDILGEAEDSNDVNFLDEVLGAADDIIEFVLDPIGLGDLYDGFKEIAVGIGDALTGEASDRVGINGIYVLPENFHLRKEAALNYYVADLDLIMVHKVAGV